MQQRQLCILGCHRLPKLVYFLWSVQYQVLIYLSSQFAAVGRQSPKRSLQGQSLPNLRAGVHLKGNNKKSRCYIYIYERTYLLLRTLQGVQAHHETADGHVECKQRSPCSVTLCSAELIQRKKNIIPHFRSRDGHTHTHTHTYIHLYIYTHLYIYIYIYIRIYVPATSRALLWEMQRKNGAGEVVKS